MKIVTICCIGETGVGKSEVGNAFCQKYLFPADCKPNSCTFETCARSNIVNDMKRYYIDTQGLQSSENCDAKHIQQMVEFLKNWTHGINAFFIVINIQNPRFDQGIQKLLKLLNDFFNNPDFWTQTGIIFTKCFAGNFNKEVAEKEYRQEVVNFVDKLPGCKDLNLQMPCFFVDSCRWQTDSATNDEYIRVFEFAHKNNPVPTQKLQFVRPEFKSEERIVKNKILIKSEIVGYGINAKKINYYQDQEIFKRIDWDNNESFTPPKVIREYKEEIPTQVSENYLNNVLVDSKIEGYGENAKKVNKYENRKVQRYLDFRTNKIEENVITLNSYTKEEKTNVRETKLTKVKVSEKTVGVGENAKKIIEYEDRKVLNYFDIRDHENKEKVITERSYTEEINSKVDYETKEDKSVTKEEVFKMVKGRRPFLGCIGRRPKHPVHDYYLVKTTDTTYQRKVITDPDGLRHYGNWQYLSSKTENHKE